VIERNILEVLPLTHIRGRSLHDAFVIVDDHGHESGDDQDVRQAVEADVDEHEAGSGESEPQRSHERRGDTDRGERYKQQGDGHDSLRGADSPHDVPQPQGRGGSGRRGHAPTLTRCGAGRPKLSTQGFVTGTTPHRCHQASSFDSSISVTSAAIAERSDRVRVM
jgi:hypothetical protein